MLLILSITILLVFLCVGIHYEALNFFQKICDTLKIRGRLKVAAGSLWALLAHIVEVWLFGIGYYLTVNKVENNSLVNMNGELAQSFMDAIYFSFISYSSLGYGDIVPQGTIRFMAATEALLGLVFIAWTATFLYLKMEQYWKTP